LYDQLIPAPLPEAPQTQSGGAIEYLDWDAIDQPAPIPEPQGGGVEVRVIALPEADRITILHDAPEPPRYDVRERAEGVTVLLDE